eukprot:sb/3462090/
MGGSSHGGDTMGSMILHVSILICVLQLSTSQPREQLTNQWSLHTQQKRGRENCPPPASLLNGGRGSGQPLSPPRRAAPGNSLRPVGPGLAEHSLIDYLVCRATELSLDTMVHFSCVCYFLLFYLFLLTPIYHAHHSFVDTYLHLHLNTKQKTVTSAQLTDLARNITQYFNWPETAIKNCYEDKVHLTCVVVGLNPVIVSTKLALDNSIDRITPILVDSVGTSNKNASVLATEEETTIVTEKMTLADVMIWVFGAVLLLLLVSLLLVYLVQKRQSNSAHKVLSNESDNDAEFYYESLVRNRIQQGGGSTSSGGALHRPPNLTQHQVASKSWSSEDKTSPEYSLSQSMDIASAHLALTYMERYITDTDKIGMEWQRLCLYEAEMKQAEVGGRSENAAKNRFSTVVPCKLRNVISSLVRNRIQQGGGSTSSGGALHRPPNLTQHQVASKSWSSEDKTSPEYSLSQSMDIASAHLALTYMERYITDTDKIGMEWQRLCLYEAEMKQAEVGGRSENAAKNRFSTVVPCKLRNVISGGRNVSLVGMSAHNGPRDAPLSLSFDRVNTFCEAGGKPHPLISLFSLSLSLYLYLSLSLSLYREGWLETICLRMYSENPKQPTYIASQGPLQPCAGEFWQMVWEQGISEIIMLSINDAVDCFQYWGSDGSGVYYHYQLHLVSEHANQPDYPDYVVRSFYLKNLQTYETRTVTQFHYVAWPMGSSTPRSTQSLLDFRRKVHKGFRGASAPLLIHCNDGIGRTGTYILMDMTLRRICKGVKEVDMEAAVEHLRDQRPGMVVTKEQYAFALSAVVEEIHQILGEMPSPSPRGGTFIGAPLE